MNSPETLLSDAGSLNLRLADLYADKLNTWKRLQAEQSAAGRCLSIPLFLKVSPAYLAASPKIVFVGQETHGWWTHDHPDVEALTTTDIMNFYEGAWTNLFENYKRSPYWRAMRKISAALGVDYPPGSFLFSNIFPCDVDRKPASPELMTVFRQWKVLEGELSVLAPDFVIFFCGPNYAYNLEPYFGAPLLNALSMQRSWVTYQPAGHPWTGIATYHPASLARLKRWSVLDEIVVAIQKHWQTPK